MALVLPQIALGQQPPADPGGSGTAEEQPALPPIDWQAPPGDIEAIEITGEREETNVQDEAEAVTRFGMADLDKLNISNVDGLAANVPGLHVGQQGQAAILTLRGIGTENASITGESAVAFHVDGISYARPTAARVAFYDIQLIDVTRGPQGLLGGKNSTSGAINVQTNDPSAEYEAQGDVLFGNYDRVRSRGHVNIPIGEFAAVRTAYFYEQRDGYLDNKTLSDSRDPFDADSFGFRSKLRLTPSDSLDFVVSYNYFKETGNGPQADLVPIAPTWPGNTCGGVSQLPPSLTCNGAVEDRDARATYANRPSSQDNRYWGTHGKLTWNTPELPLLGETEVELRGGYQRTDTGFDWDFDASNSPITIFNLDSSALSHEYVADARWRGLAADEALEWQTSLFFSRERADAFTDAVNSLGDSGGQTMIPQSVENKSYGAALHGAYHISDAVTFQLGGRWIKDRKESLLDRVAWSYGEPNRGTVEMCRGTGGGLNILRRPDGTFDYGSIAVEPCNLTDRGTMWGSALEWRPLDGHLLYVGIDRGFKSGGFQLGGVGQYGPEHIWAYKAGTKSEFLDGTLQVNLEGFFYNYDDMQIALIDGLQIRTESANTRMYGVELEANAEPIEGLRFGAVIGHLNTEVLEYDSLDPATLGDAFMEDLLTKRTYADLLGTPYALQSCINPQTRRRLPCGQLNTTFNGDTIRSGLVDFSGNDLSRAPEWKVTLSAEYEFQVGRFGSLTPRIHYAWQDDTYFRAFNRDFDLQEAYHRTDAKLLWDSPEQRWTAELFVENIEDEADTSYVLVGSRAFSAPLLAWYNTPRFYGFRVGFKY